MERNVGQFCLGGMHDCIHNFRGVLEEDAWKLSADVEDEETKRKNKKFTFQEKKL